MCVETNSVMLVMQFKHMAFPALLNNPFTIINAWRCVKRLAPGLKLLAELFVGWGSIHLACETFVNTIRCWHATCCNLVREAWSIVPTQTVRRAKAQKPFCADPVLLALIHPYPIQYLPDLVLFDFLLPFAKNNNSPSLTEDGCMASAASSRFREIGSPPCWEAGATGSWQAKVREA